MNFDFFLRFCLFFTLKMSRFEKINFSKFSRPKFQKWNKISKFQLLHDFRIIEVSRDKFSYLLFPSFLHMLYIYLSWFQKAHLSPNSRHYWFYEHLTVVHWSKKWPKNWSKKVFWPGFWKKWPSNCYSSFTVWLFSLKICEKNFLLEFK